MPMDTIVHVSAFAARSGREGQNPAIIRRSAYLPEPEDGTPDRLARPEKSRSNEGFAALGRRGLSAA